MYVSLWLPWLPPFVLRYCITARGQGSQAEVLLTIWAWVCRRNRMGDNGLGILGDEGPGLEGLTPFTSQHLKRCCSAPLWLLGDDTSRCVNHSGLHEHWGLRGRCWKYLWPITSIQGAVGHDKKVSLLVLKFPDDKNFWILINNQYSWGLITNPLSQNFQK